MPGPYPVIHGKGTVIQYATTATGFPNALSSAYTTIARVPRIKPPKRDYDETDITDLATSFVEGSNTIFAHIYIPGWVEQGMVDFDIYFGQEVADALTGLENLSVYWRIQFPLRSDQTTLGAHLDWQGFIKSKEWKEIKVGDKNPLTIPISVKVSGIVYFADGT